VSLWGECIEGVTKGECVEGVCGVSALREL
jgi:hypothetical protein